MEAQKIFLQTESSKILLEYADVIKESMIPASEWNESFHKTIAEEGGSAVHLLAVFAKYGFSCNMPHRVMGDYYRHVGFVQRLRAFLNHLKEYKTAVYLRCVLVFVHVHVHVHKKLYVNAVYVCVCCLFYCRNIQEAQTQLSAACASVDVKIAAAESAANGSACACGSGSVETTKGCESGGAEALKDDDGCAEPKKCKL